MYRHDRKTTLQTIAATGLFAAVIAVLSQVSIPLPWGMPVSLQTFAVALAGASLGRRGGCAAVAAYLALGALGAPVFTGFKGGFGVLIGPTGGFLFGFLLLAALSSLSARGIRGEAAAMLGLALCHLLGCAQYSLVTKTPLFTSFLLASVPFLVKDILSVVLARHFARRLNKSAGRLS